MKKRMLNKLKKQKAVYWAKGTNDGFGGYTYGDPIELKVTWLFKQEKFVSALDGEELVSTSVVLVDRDLVMGGMLALTTLSDLSSSGLPEDNGAFEIKAYTKVPDYKGTNFSRKVWLESKRN